MKTDPGGNGAPSRRRPVIFEPLKHRDFRLLWSGMTVSLIGDGIFIVTLAWQVYELSDAPTALSLVGLAMTVPNVLFLLIGGVVSDRFDRRRVLVAADLVRGLGVGAMGLLSLSGGLELWHLMVLAAVYGGGTAFFGPAFDAIVPDLVASDLLIQANALDQFVRPAAWRLAGPAIGGVLVAWSTGGAFLVDAATFAVSVVSLLLMSPHPIDGPEGEPTSALADVREGFRFVRQRVWLWGTLVAAAFAYLLFIGPQEVLPRAVAISPDGRYVAYLAGPSGHEKTYLRLVGERDARVIAELPWQSPQPFFSPDSQWIAFFDAGKLKKMPVAGGVPVTLADAPTPRGGTWGADGTIVFAPISRGGLMSLPEDGGVVRPLTTLDDARGETSHRQPAFVGQSRTVLFVADGTSDRFVRAVSLDTKEVRVVRPGDALRPIYTPTGAGPGKSRP